MSLENEILPVFFTRFFLGMKFACAYVFARKNLFWHRLCNKEKFVVFCIYGLVYLTSNIFFFRVS